MIRASHCLKARLHFSYRCILSSTTFHRRFLTHSSSLPLRRATDLAPDQPVFSLSSDHVRILARPSDFYQKLLEMIRRARRRIYISTLYIGTEETELIQTLYTSLAENSSLRLTLMLDLRRSTRPGAASTASLLVPLLRAFPERVQISMFQSPKLKGLMAQLVPRRFDEGWGTWHAKIYGIDDEVMFSGANLNTSYFTDRQDRYLHFSNQPVLAEYCMDFLRLFSRFSYRLTSPSSDSYDLAWCNPDVPSTNYEPDAENAIKSFRSDQRSKLLQSKLPADHDTILLPLVQSGPFNIREEEEALIRLINSPAGLETLLDLTSGYFALHMPYQAALLQSRRLCRVLAAGPKANGFYGSKGVSGRIPEGYTLFEKRFWSRVVAAGLDNDRVSLSEWEKPGWTYHAKGIWQWPSEGQKAATSLADYPLQGPDLTLFGSTNLNSRSAHLDTELSFLMVTKSDTLRQSLREEVIRLRADALRVDHRTWEAKDRRVRWGTRLLLLFMGGML